MNPELCNEYGFYMIAEADLESHGVGTLYTNDGHDCMGYIAQDSTLPMFLSLIMLMKVP